jgi:phosphonate transport system permease protein
MKPEVGTGPSAGPPSRVSKAVGLALLFASVLFCGAVSDVELGRLFDKAGAQSAYDLFGGFLHPDLSNDFLWRVLQLSIESLLIGILATTMAVALGFVLALIAIKIPELPDSPKSPWPIRAARDSSRFVARTILGITRSIPAIVWAYIFVRTIGLGPGAAVLAIAVSTSGIVGKLYAELAEAVDPEPLHALRRAGCGQLAILLFGVLPAVWKQWLSYSLFRLECSIRSASILGVVGAGGLGAEIALSVRYFEFDKLATILMAVLAFVILVEVASTVLRRKPLRWSVSVALAGSAWALLSLNIPWSEISLSTLVPEWLLRGGSVDAFVFVKRALWLAGETVAMAWAATMVAALFALLLSPFAASTFSLRGHNREAARGRGVTSTARWVSFLGARLILQICRAMPELTLALVFVVWVGPGSFAGFLAISFHTVGVLGRLYTDVYEEAEPAPLVALESMGTGRLAVWLYGVFPQVFAKLIAFTLYRFEVNVRATAMIGFVGAGGLGDEIHTAISLFHGRDLVLLLGIMIALVTLLDLVGDRVRHRVLTSRFASRSRKRVMKRGGGIVVPTNSQ